MRVADRRSRSTFWLDDAIVDRCGPWLGRFSMGTAALAVYMVLARHAGRDSEAWPTVARLASQAGCKERTVQTALRLLELAGLIGVYASTDGETGKPTTNTYVLLAPPKELPSLSLDPSMWKRVERERVTVRTGADGRRFVAEWQDNQGRNICTPTPAESAPPPRNICAPRARPRSSEGKPSEGQGPSDDQKPHDWGLRLAWCQDLDNRPPGWSVERCATELLVTDKQLKVYRPDGRRR